MLTLSVSRALVGSTSGSSPRCYTCCDETRTASCVARLLKVVVLWRSKYIKTNLWDVLCCVTRSSMGFFTYAWSVAVNQIVFSELSSECCLCFHVGLGRRAWGRGVWGASLNHSVWRPGLSKHDVHFEEHVQLCDVSEQTPHLPSWLLTCTRGESDLHLQASFFGGTGDRKMQAQGTWKEPVLRCSRKEHLVKMMADYSCLRDLTSTSFLTLVLLTFGLNPTQPLALP